MSSQVPQAPTYEQSIEYYLRDDVSSFLWRLCQTRQLKFFHHSNSDIRLTREMPEAISFHCEADVEEFRRRIRKAATNIPSYPYTFFPFWGIQSSRVNAPGFPDHLVGWDARFEFDYNQKQSFAAVLPLAGALTYFKVPYLIKFSGHRSLHLIIPAESFPLEMKEQPDHKSWMSLFELLGDFFCRISPYINATCVGLSKETVLTAPYSLHRYNGLISLPLSLEDALSFDAKKARFGNSLRVTANFPDATYAGLEMREFLDFLKSVQKHPETILRVTDFYKGPLWECFFQDSAETGLEAGPTSDILMAGICGLKKDLDFAQRPEKEKIAKALIAIDKPENKTIKQLRMVGEIDYNVTFETWVRLRRTSANILDAWICGGIDLALNRILAIITDESYKSPFLLGLRLSTILPENAEIIVSKLRNFRKSQCNQMNVVDLFYTLAISQFAADSSDLHNELEEAHMELFRDLLRSSCTWHVDEGPMRTIAALCLAYKPETVYSWVNNPDSADAQLVIKNAFGDNVKKFQYQSRSLLQKAMN